MDRPIQVGDLVQIIGNRNPVGKHDNYLGHIGVVTAPCGDCGGCGHWIVEGTDPFLRWWHGHLKRIPPLDEMDDVKRDEEITA